MTRLPLPVAALLLGLAGPALAQPPAARPPIMGPTGTMYDGGNTRLGLPADGPDIVAGASAGPYSAPPEARAPVAGAGQSAGPNSATGAGASGASGGGSKTGGEH